MQAESKQAAAIWARQVLETDFVVLDTETTGLDDQAEAVSIAIVNRNGRTLLDCLLCPRRPIPEAVTKVHGITNADVVGAAYIYELEPVLFSLLSGRPVLIYNADYDLRILRQSLNMSSIEGIINPGLVGCVMNRFAEFYGEWDDRREHWRWQKLATAARYFGADTTGAHGAAADCRMALAVVKGMAAGAAVKGESWPDTSPGVAFWRPGEP